MKRKLMKGKGSWRRWLSTMLIMTLLSFFPGTVSGAEKPEWRYGESILIEVKVDGPKKFSPEDFPAIDCKRVFVLEKRTREDGVEYQLVLIPDASRKTELKEDIEKLLTLPIVTHAEKNRIFVTLPEFYLTLTHPCLYLAVGETADVTMKDCNIYDEDRIYGIKFEPDPAYFDMEALRKDSFSAYGITSFWPDIQGIWTIVMPEERPEELEGQKSENGWYYGIAGNANEHIFEVLNLMAAVPEFPFVSIVRSKRVPSSGYGSVKNRNLEKNRLGSERRFDESWYMENTDIAEYVLSGGNDPGPLDNPRGKTATVRGLKPGITKLTCEESKYDTHVASDCIVMVYESGNKNNPGDLDHDGAVDTDDALQALKNSVGLIFLDEAGKKTGDLNQDNVVDEKDALLMLKIAAGII